MEQVKDEQIKETPTKENQTKENQTKEERAKELFFEGYNCSQAVVGAFLNEIGLDAEKSKIISMVSSFGGGMGRLREVCGAVSGMFLVAGALYGYDDPKDLNAKKEHYQRIQELAAKFKEINGSIICRELLGLDGKDTTPSPSPRTKEYYEKRPCPDKIGSAARLMEEYIKEHPVTVHK